MFRSLKGYKAQYHDLTLLVASDFDEYRVLVQAPGTLIQGRRQFNENQAKEHARALASSYLAEKNAETTPVASLDWAPFSAGDWLSWNP